jgi:hypothetical protein
MKTFDEILDKVYSQPELIDKLKTAFDEYTADEKNAVTIALDEIWEELTPIKDTDNNFKDRTMSFNTVASTVAYDLPYGKIKSVKESTSSKAMSRGDNFDNMPVLTGKPYRYSDEGNKINLYPTPDAVYVVNVKYFTDYKALAGTTEQDTLELETDVLNIPEYLENHFLITLGYKAGMNINSAPASDEEYTHWSANYQRALTLLKLKSNRSASPPSFI